LVTIGVGRGRAAKAVADGRPGVAGGRLVHDDAIYASDVEAVEGGL
jgi:hypothetical protein